MAGEEERKVYWMWQMLWALSRSGYKEQAVQDIPNKACHLQSISVDSRRP